MKNYHILLILVILFNIGCVSTSVNNSIEINEKMLIDNVKIISHDSMAGRGFGGIGNRKAQKFIASQFDSLGLQPAFTNGSIQQFDYVFKDKNELKNIDPIVIKNIGLANIQDTIINGGNVVVKIKGKLKETIVITAHLDHLGTNQNLVFNGADDNASGAAALITIANYFQHKSPDHTLVFAAVDAEEVGSLGANYLIENFPEELGKIVLNINMDMIANDKASGLYASGIYHYPYLKKPLEKINSRLELKFGHDDPNQENVEDWTYMSDHSEFHRRKIPFIYFGVESHEDYHQPSDKFQNINGEFYTEAVKLIIQAIENVDSFLANKNRE